MPFIIHPIYLATNSFGLRVNEFDTIDEYLKAEREHNAHLREASPDEDEDEDECHCDEVEMADLNWPEVPAEDEDSVPVRIKIEPEEDDLMPMNPESSRPPTSLTAAPERNDSISITISDHDRGADITPGAETEQVTTPRYRVDVMTETVVICKRKVTITLMDDEDEITSESDAAHSAPVRTEPSSSNPMAMKEEPMEDWAISDRQQLGESSTAIRIGDKAKFKHPVRVNKELFPRRDPVWVKEGDLIDGVSSMRIKTEVAAEDPRLVEEETYGCDCSVKIKIEPDSDDEW